MPANLREICVGLHANRIEVIPSPGGNGFFRAAQTTLSTEARPGHRLLAVHAGMARAQSGSRHCRVGAGGFLWLSRDGAHELILEKGTRVSALDFTLLRRRRPVSLDIPFAWFAHGGESFDLLARAARDPWVRDDEETRMRLKAWLILILATMERWIHRKPSAALGESHRMAVTELVSRNLHGRLSMAHVASRLSLSPDYCSRLFTATYGHSLRQHLLEERMKAAARDLASGNETVRAIAARYGYESVPSFSRLFKQVLGVNPARRRRG